MAKKRGRRKPNPKAWKPTDAAFPIDTGRDASSENDLTGKAEPKPKLMRFKVIHPFKDKNGVHRSRRDGYLEMPYEEARPYVRRRQLMLSKQPEVQDV